MTEIIYIIFMFGLIFFFFVALPVGLILLIGYVVKNVFRKLKNHITLTIRTGFRPVLSF